MQWSMEVDVGECIYRNYDFHAITTAARLAQSVERETLTIKRYLKAAGSTPALGSIPSAQAWLASRLFASSRTL